MEKFVDLIKQSSNKCTLISMKEEIKDSICKPIHWEERIQLYEKVKLINERIKQIKSNHQPLSK